MENATGTFWPLYVYVHIAFWSEQIGVFLNSHLIGLNSHKPPF